MRKNSCLAFRMADMPSGPEVPDVPTVTIVTKVRAVISSIMKVWMKDVLMKYSVDG